MSIPVKTLIVTASQAAAMERNLWTDQFVAASMKSGGKTEPIQIRFRGGHTREYPKRSFDVVRGGETYHYNAEYDDPSMIRNALSFAFFRMIGVPAPRCRHVFLYRNSTPLGVYLEIESVGRRFFRRRGIGAVSLFYAINNMADFGLYRSDSGQPKSSLLSGYEHRFGGDREKIRLISFIRGFHPMSVREAAAYFQKRLDVDQYLHWLAGAVLTGNYDGFEQNYSIYRHRRTGKYRMIPWDYEGTWGRNCYGQIQEDDLVPVTGYNHLTRKLLEHRPYRVRYGEILLEALKGPFTESKLMPIVRRMMAAIRPHVREDPMRRWSYDEFQKESDVIRRHIRVRRSIVAKELDELT